MPSYECGVQIEALVLRIERQIGKQTIEIIICRTFIQVLLFLFEY